MLRCLLAFVMAGAVVCMHARNPDTYVVADSVGHGDADVRSDSASISALDASEYIRAVAEYRFTPPPVYPAIVDGYGRFDSIRADFLDLARIQAPVRGVPFDVSGNTMLAGWDGGAVGAFGSMQYMPGLMGIEEGGLQVVQNVDNVTFGVGATVSKYAYFGGMSRKVGFHGSVQWRINDVLSVRAFGSYYGKNAFVSPAVAGYMGADSYGAALRVDASEKWGMDLGVRRVYNVMSGRWETVPIARPFFKINGKEAIGVDVGGILHSLLRSKIGGGHGNPTMGPPIPMGAPPVRPRVDW